MRSKQRRQRRRRGGTNRCRWWLLYYFYYSLNLNVAAFSYYIQEVLLCSLPQTGSGTGEKLKNKSLSCFSAAAAVSFLYSCSRGSAHFSSYFWKVFLFFTLSSLSGFLDSHTWAGLLFHRTFSCLDFFCLFSSLPVLKPQIYSNHTEEAFHRCMGR